MELNIYQCPISSHCPTLENLSNETAKKEIGKLELILVHVLT